MEISHLRAFVAVAKQRNITRAAAELRLTPSPVSRTIRELERELGGALFVREYHSLTLTERGQTLLASAIEILRISDEVLGTASSALRLAATPWSPARFAARLQELAPSEWSGEIEFEEAMSSELIPRLIFGEIDAAIVHLPVDFPGIEVRPIAAYRHVLVGYPKLDTAEPQEDPAVLMLPVQLQQLTMGLLAEMLHGSGFSNVEEIAFADLITVRSRMRRTGEKLLTTLSKDTPIGALIDFDELEHTELPLSGTEPALAIAYRSTDARRLPALLRIVEAMAPAGKPIAVV